MAQTFFLIFNKAGLININLWCESLHCGLCVPSCSIVEAGPPSKLIPKNLFAVWEVKTRYPPQSRSIWTMALTFVSPWPQLLQVSLNTLASLVAAEIRFLTDKVQVWYLGSFSEDHMRCLGTCAVFHEGTKQNGVTARLEVKILFFWGSTIQTLPTWVSSPDARTTESRDANHQPSSFSTQTATERCLP